MTSIGDGLGLGPPYAGLGPVLEVFAAARLAPHTTASWFVTPQAPPPVPVTSRRRPSVREVARAKGRPPRRLCRRAYTSLARRVYLTCMSRTRTNIEIEDSYVQVIMDRYGVRTKTDAVELALRHLAGQPFTREEALAMRGAHAIAQSPADVPPRGSA